MLANSCLLLHKPVVRESIVIDLSSERPEKQLHIIYQLMCDYHATENVTNNKEISNKFQEEIFRLLYCRYDRVLDGTLVSRIVDDVFLGESCDHAHEYMTTHSYLPPAVMFIHNQLIFSN